MNKKIKVNFPHVHAGIEYPAGSIIDLPARVADFLCGQRLDDQPVASSYEGADPAVNPAA